MRKPDTDYHTNFYDRLLSFWAYLVFMLTISVMSDTDGKFESVREHPLQTN